MYNIRDFQGFGLHQGIWDVQLGNYDLMLLMETKILDQAYCHNFLSYDVMCSQVVGTATRVAQGGVVQVLRENLDGWSVDSTHLHGTNIVSWELVS